MHEMLQLQTVRVAIQGADVLRGISLGVRPGGLVALVGRNGAGKTTTLRTIMGLVRLKEGRICVDGKDLGRLAAFERARLGIGYVPEDRRLIGQLSVLDNLLLPAWGRGHAHAARRLEHVYRIVPEVKVLTERRAAQLSGGQQKLVAVARALMSATKLLLLDEPFEGLSLGLGERLAAILGKIQSSGIAVLVAESDLKRVGFVEHTYTIERGDIITPPPDMAAPRHTRQYQPSSGPNRPDRE